MSDFWLGEWQRDSAVEIRAMSAMHMDLEQNVEGHDGVPTGWVDALFMENLLKDGWLSV